MPRLGWALGAALLIELVAIRDFACGPFPASGLALHPGGDALDDCGALKLGKDTGARLDHHPTSGGRGVERLGGRAEEDLCYVKALQGVLLRETSNRASEAVDAIHSRRSNRLVSASRRACSSSGR